MHWKITIMRLLFCRSYYYPRVSGLERQVKCEDPAYQRDPKNTNMYDGALNINTSISNLFYEIDKDGIVPVNTYYPKGTVCYVDNSGGRHRTVTVTLGPKYKRQNQKIISSFVFHHLFDIHGNLSFKIL